MTDTSNTEPVSAPEPRIVRKKKSVSWIWIVPIVAALAGLSMVVRTWMMAGPEIVISFSTGEGIEVGKTQVRYKDVAVGTVSGVGLSKDRSRVEVQASLRRDVADFAREGARFWVVRPRFELSGVSGLNTIMSGAYIAVDLPPEAEAAEARDEFEGLESPPEVASGRPGSRYVLHAASLGSLAIGSPVYFRRMKAGQVIGYQLADDGKHVDIQIFLDKPFNGFVTSNSRFWNASGLDVSVGASGFDVHMQSLASVLAGGLAFEDIEDGEARPAEDGQEFELFASESDARSVVEGERMPLRFRVNSSVRGLSIGADVDFRGMSLGHVTAIRMDFDDASKRFYTTVDAEIYPARLGNVYEKLSAQPEGEDAFMAGMVEHGLRAQLRTGNLLTGQLYVSLDFFPGAAPISDYDPSQRPRQIPVVPGTFDQLQEQLSSIVTKLDSMPLEDIGTNLKNTLGNASALLGRVEKDLAPAASSMLNQARDALAQADRLVAPDGSMTANMERTMQEMQRAARALRELADSLQAQPDALLRGRADDPDLFQGAQ